MPVNTITVGAAVTPTVIHTYLSHYLNRRPLREKPTAHISYHEGLELIRRFLHYASFHTVEELQAFTSQWVPVPIWVDVDRIEIPSSQLRQAADHIRAQLGPEGIAAIGGRSWWEWRRDQGTSLQAEWIEMRKDMEERKKSANINGQRIMLYVHGGAYFFGSVDEHRYQLQRHARKLKARVLAPRYRLAPQFPFPCGLMDCLAAYLYLLEEKHDPSTIILAGDSAGGGMILSMLVTLRDQGIPLPAGAILISPWVDLAHSFPSLGGDGKLDYIPAHGFIHKPSMSWPPPNADDRLVFERETGNLGEDGTPRRGSAEDKAERVRGFSVQPGSESKFSTRGSADQHAPKAELLPEGGGAKQDLWVSSDGKYSIGPLSTLSVQLEDVRVEIKDQIQMYTPNHMLTHPLVSPALQPSLGGLPPLLILVGGGELLKDEQIYVAHKAASPLSYPPPPSNNQNAEKIQAEIARHRPTNVQLQVWDDLCHVAPTLSFTRPAKHMYRSIAQFGAWALARAQKTSIDILDDDSISIVSADSSASSTTATESDNNPSPDDIKLNMPQSARHVNFSSVGEKDEGKARVGRAGDTLPTFEKHMIRERVDRHGQIYPLAAPSELEALRLPTIEIGVPKPGPVGKWMKAQEHWNSKFAKQKLKIQKQRMTDMRKGYEGFKDETPPPTALAGRQVKGMKKEKKAKKSWGMAMWSGWGSKHDKATVSILLGREERAEQSPDRPDPAALIQQPDQPPTDGVVDQLSPKTHRKASKRGLQPASLPSRSRSRSRHSTVTYQNQISPSVEELLHIAPPTPGLAEATVIAPERKASALPSPMSEFSSMGAPTPTIVFSADGEEQRPQSPETLIPGTDTLSTRPTRGGVAYPFRLKVEGDEKNANASTLTLQSVDIKTPGIEEPERPGFERFETAQEDLSTLANGKVE
ncbi:alpha/beta-hydrolase [Byssothecium circinans]|uniref:Alpha/beta-hydrolase n=1 Tax=Byssothecium circinans TaxID=147558 RepID=A0A6A5TPW2_9PLEO|nr:alpha/beta-hydrolase [Byssothecium circinans]